MSSSKFTKYLKLAVVFTVSSVFLLNWNTLLPSSGGETFKVLDPDSEERVRLDPEPNKPLAGMAEVGGVGGGEIRPVLARGWWNDEVARDAESAECRGACLGAADLATGTATGTKSRIATGVPYEGLPTPWNMERSLDLEVEGRRR